MKLLEDVVIKLEDIKEKYNKGLVVADQHGIYKKNPNMTNFLDLKDKIRSSEMHVNTIEHKIKT